MLGYKLKSVFFVIVTFVFIVLEVSPDDDIEVNVQLDNTEEQSIISNEQTDPNVSIEEKKVNHGVDVKINKEKKTNNTTKDGTNKKGVGNIKKENIGNDRQNTNDDTHEVITRFKEKRKPLWKIKDEPGKRQEPGFDLTPEEKNKFKIWKGGIIPYYIDVVSFNDKVLRDKIRNYLQIVNSAAGINFVELSGSPSDDNERWVFFMNRRGLLGCADHTVRNFTTQGVQKVVLGYDCIETRGEIAEAVMSIAGVPAQHNAPDRDEHIQINIENIMPDKKYLFEKLNDNEWLFHDLDYDFKSITHYDVFKYSVNGRSTIQLKDDSTDLSLAKKLSDYDLLKIKMLYNYITKNVKLKLPECEKLFKPRSKFVRFVPHRIHVKPRTKPSRYLGTSDKRLSLSHKFRHTKYL